MAQSSHPDKLILLGRIGAAHGIRGEVRIKSHADDPLAIGSYGPLVTRDGREFEIAKARLSKNMVIARLKGIDDRNQAERLNGTDLFVSRDRLGDQTEPDEFMQADLIGLKARLEDGTEFGNVSGVDNFGAGDVLRIVRKSGGTEFLPFTMACVPEVDVASGYLVVSLPDEIEVRDEGEDAEK